MAENSVFSDKRAWRPKERMLGRGLTHLLSIMWCDKSHLLRHIRADDAKHVKNYQAASGLEMSKGAILHKQLKGSWPWKRPKN
jgi:hypothetical protein